MIPSPIHRYNSTWLQVLKAKQHVLDKLEARVAGSSDAELSRLLGENEATAKRRAAITARLQVGLLMHTF